MFEYFLLTWNNFVRNGTPYYYLLIIYMKKLCSHVRKLHLEIKKNCISFFALYIIFWHCISKRLHCPQPIKIENFFMYITVKIT
jgi:hypothetical protein